MDKCDECGKRIAKDLQICRACFKIYQANRERLAKEAREECARAENELWEGSESNPKNQGNDGPV